MPVTANIFPPSYTEPWEWGFHFLEACKDGNINNIHHLGAMAASPEDKIKRHKDIQIGLSWACMRGHMDVVRYLISSPQWTSWGYPCGDLHSEEASAFNWACRGGHVNIVEYLTTSFELQRAGIPFCDIHAHQHEGFRLACEGGHLEVVRFLTTSPLLQQAGHTLVDIHVNDEEALRWGCINRYLGLVQFLTTSPELKAAGQTWADVNNWKVKRDLFVVLEDGYEEAVKWCLWGIPHERALKVTPHDCLGGNERVQEWIGIQDQHMQWKDLWKNAQDQTTDQDADESSLTKPLSRRL